jgi:hypothetical protein
MGLRLQRAALSELLAHPAHRGHAKTQELGDLTGAFAAFVELQNAPAHRQRYGSHRHTLANNSLFVKLHHLWKRSKRGFFQSICATHLVVLSMSEPVIAQGKDWQNRDDEAQSQHPVRAER